MTLAPWGEALRKSIRAFMAKRSLTSRAVTFDLARRLVPLSPPNSGLPEFGKHGAQVGQARPAWRGWGEGLSELELKTRAPLTRLASLATLSTELGLARVRNQ